MIRPLHPLRITVVFELNLSRILVHWIQRAQIQPELHFQGLFQCEQELKAFDLYSFVMSSMTGWKKSDLDSYSPVLACKPSLISQASLKTDANEAFWSYLLGMLLLTPPSALLGLVLWPSIQWVAVNCPFNHSYLPCTYTGERNSHHHKPTEETTEGLLSLQTGSVCAFRYWDMWIKNSECLQETQFT